MADNLSNWIADEVGGKAIQALAKSALESVAVKEPMATDVKNVPVGAAFTISAKDKHSAYDETTDTASTVTLTARRIGGYARIAVEDINDSNFDVLETRKNDAGLNMAKYLDNAAFAVTGAENGTTVPFTSVYAAVNAAASSHIIKTAGALTFDDVNVTLSVAEGSDFAADGDGIVVVAHPAFRGYFRGLKDGDNNPLMGTLVRDGRNIESLLGYDIVWSNGLKTSVTASQAPNGNHLLVVAPRSLLVEGIANLPGLDSSVPGFAMQAPGNGSGFLTEEVLLKAAVRRGFAIHDAANSFGLIEKTAG